MPCVSMVGESERIQRIHYRLYPPVPRERTKRVKRGDVRSWRRTHGEDGLPVPRTHVWKAHGSCSHGPFFVASRPMETSEASSRAPNLRTVWSDEWGVVGTESGKPWRLLCSTSTE